MNKKSPIPSAVSSRIKSFKHAFDGIADLVMTQANARIHVGAAVIIGAFGLSVGLSASEWRWIVLSIGLVLAVEAMNTSLEHLCDVVTLEHHEGIKRAKDVAAGAVLIVSIAAGIIGVTIFLPYFVKAI